MWVIEPIDIGDLDECVAIEQAAFGEDAWPAPSVREELVGENRIAMGARIVESGQLIGYATALLVHDFSHLATKGVLPVFRRKGVATGLLKAMIAESIEGGVNKMTLEVGLLNKAAQALYAIYGFKEEGIRSNYYPNGDAAVIMWCHNLKGNE